MHPAVLTHYFFIGCKQKNSTLSFPWVFSHPIRTSLLSRLVRAWSSKRLEGHHAYATQYRTQTKTTTRWTLDLIFPGDYEFKFSIFCLFQYQVYLFLFRYRQYVKHACICMYKYSECRLQESSNTHFECHWSNHRIRLLSRTFQNQPKQRPLGTRYSGNVWNSPTHGILYCLNWDVRNSRTSKDDP